MEDCLRLPSVFSIARLTLQRPAESLERSDYFFHPMDTLSVATCPSEHAAHLVEKVVGITEFRQQHRDVCLVSVTRFHIVIEHL